MVRYYNQIYCSYYLEMCRNTESLFCVTGTNIVLQDNYGEGNGTPLQYFCLENPMDGGAWQAAVLGVAKSRIRLSNSLFTFMHWRRKWQPTPVFLPGESQGLGSLVGCRLWGCTELDTTEVTQQQQQQQQDNYTLKTKNKFIERYQICNYQKQGELDEGINL